MRILIHEDRNLTIFNLGNFLFIRMWGSTLIFLSLSFHAYTEMARNRQNSELLRKAFRCFYYQRWVSELISHFHCDRSRSVTTIVATCDNDIGCFAGYRQKADIKISIACHGTSLRLAQQNECIGVRFLQKVQTVRKISRSTTVTTLCWNIRIFQQQYRELLTRCYEEARKSLR